MRALARHVSEHNAPPVAATKAPTRGGSTTVITSARTASGGGCA